MKCLIAALVLVFSSGAFAETLTKKEVSTAVLRHCFREQVQLLDDLQSPVSDIARAVGAVCGGKFYDTLEAHDLLGGAGSSVGMGEQMLTNLSLSWVLAYRAWVRQQQSGVPSTNL